MAERSRSPFPGMEQMQTEQQQIHQDIADIKAKLDTQHGRLNEIDQRSALTNSQLQKDQQLQGVCRGGKPPRLAVGHQGKPCPGRAPDTKKPTLPFRGFAFQGVAKADLWGTLQAGQVHVLQNGISFVGEAADRRG